MNSLEVSIYLTTLLTFFFFITKKGVGRGASVRVLFLVLFLMVSPGFIIDVQRIFFWGKVGIVNITLFMVLLMTTAIPWISFDKWFNKIPAITVTDRGAKYLSTVFIIVIISCFFSYVYIFPYAVRSFALGAAETRNVVNSQESVMPTSILTTFAVGVSSISPFYIFFLFLSWLHPLLKKYSFLLFICSFIYIVVSMPFMARDGFVTLPLFFLIFYMLFNKSLPKQNRKAVIRYFMVVIGVAGVLLLIYSINRFLDNSINSSNSSRRFISGTWGYLFQQPYVFDRTLNYQESWHGLNLRFPLLAELFGQPPKEIVRYQDFETMFGTMLSEFYSIGGYWSLFVFTIAFILIYYWGLHILTRRNNIANVFFFFITYLMIEVTGLFYYRYGGITFNWLFFILTLLPFFFMKNKIIIARQ